MNKPKYEKEPMFPREGHRFELYMFEDSGKSHYFKDAMWERISREKGLSRDQIEGDREKERQYRELRKEFDNLGIQHPLFLLKDDYQNYDSQFFMFNIDGGNTFYQLYKHGSSGSGFGFEHGEYILFKDHDDLAKYREPANCESEIGVDKFELRVNQTDGTCVLLIGKTGDFLVGKKKFDSDKEVLDALKAVNNTFSYLRDDMYDVCNFLKIPGTSDTFLFYRDIVKYKVSGYLFNPKEKTYTKIGDDVVRNVYRDGGTTELKFSINGGNHDIHIDTPWKGENRKKLFDGVVSLEELKPEEHIEDLNIFSELTGVKFIDPLRRKGLFR